MTQEQLRLDVQSTVKQYIFNLMNQNSIPAAMMEDALNAALLDVKDAVLRELVNASAAEAASQAVASKPEQPMKNDKEKGSGK